MLELALKPTKKIIKMVREAYPLLKIVGFKAETDLDNEELLARARASLKGGDLDLVVANDVSRGGMGTDDNRVLILDRSGSYSEAEGKKSLIAGKIIDSLVGIL